MYVLFMQSGVWDLADCLKFGLWKSKFWIKSEFGVNLLVFISPKSGFTNFFVRQFFRPFFNERSKISWHFKDPPGMPDFCPPVYLRTSPPDCLITCPQSRESCSPNSGDGVRWAVACQNQQKRNARMPMKKHRQTHTERNKKREFVKLVLNHFHMTTSMQRRNGKILCTPPPSEVHNCAGVRIVTKQTRWSLHLDTSPFYFRHVGQLVCTKTAKIDKWQVTWHWLGLALCSCIWLFGSIFLGK